jgi:hypothetical protein
MHRKLIVLHTVLASFFFPMGIMYAVTGGLYGLGIKGQQAVTEYVITLDSPLTPELSTLSALVERELASRSIATPSGSASVKKSDALVQLDWTGIARDIELTTAPGSTTAKMKVKEANWHRVFVQLHKAKGGEVFKWFAALWMVGLIALFISGGMMALGMRPYRKLALVWMTLGVASFVVLALLS